MSVAEAQQRISSGEFAEWRAFYELADAQASGAQPEPTPSELTAKIHAWAAATR